MNNTSMGIIKEIMGLIESERQSGKDIVSLGVGVPFYGMPQEMKQYISKRIIESNEVDVYTPFAGLPHLRSKIAEQLTGEYGVELNGENVMVTVGSMAALYYAMAVIVQAGDEVIVPSPYFLSYADQAEMVGGKVIEVPMIEEAGGWKVDVSAIERAITERTKAILVNSPNNPTGSVIDKETLESIAQLAITHNLYVITDDAYDFLVYDSGYSSIASIRELWPRVICCGSFSKKYGMTGWRIGYLVAGKEVMGNLMRVHDNINVCAPHVSQDVLYYALTHEIGEIEQNKEALLNNRDLICERLDRLSDLFSYARPEGAFYVLPKFKLEISSVEFSSLLLKEVMVATLPGAIFGAVGEGHVRLSFGSRYEDIQKAFDRIDAWWEKRKND